MTDEEWAFFAPFVIATGGKRGRPPADHRRVLDGVFWIARTGAPWRDLHDYFGSWSSVYRQFRRWTLAGIWELMLEALNDSGAAPDSVQMIDSTVIRAHHQAAGAKGGLRNRVLGARKVASRPSSTCAPTPRVSPSRSRSPAERSPTTKATIS
jgi:transposase